MIYLEKYGGNDTFHFKLGSPPAEERCQPADPGHTGSFSVDYRYPDQQMSAYQVGKIFGLGIKSFIHKGFGGQEY